MANWILRSKDLEKSERVFQYALFRLKIMLVETDGQAKSIILNAPALKIKLPHLM